MAGRHVDPEQQVLQHRNRLFVWVPSLILLLLLAVLVWEIVRMNVSAADQTRLPWRLTFLGVSSAASLAGVFAGLLLARQQFARSVRPILGWESGWVPPGAADNAGSPGRLSWVVKVHNGGSGLGVVKQAQYRVVSVADVHAPRSSDEWVSIDAARELLCAAGLVRGEHFKLSQLGIGHPLVASTKSKEGYVVAVLTEEVIDRIAALDLRLRVTDMVGDVHERCMPLLKDASAELEQVKTAQGEHGERSQAGDHSVQDTDGPSA